VSLVQPELHQLQRAFISATYAGSDATFPGVIAEAGIPAGVRLNIYRNNTITNLCNALKADYPVLERLVGNDFFLYAARCYIAQTPSRSGDINDYGDDFPKFIAGFPAASTLPYLGDVAYLERAWKRSYYAADAEAIDALQLSVVALERLSVLRFNLHPAVQLLSSPYPVTRIWSANQFHSEPAEQIDLDAGAELILLQRVVGSVEITLLPPVEYVWLVALRDGHCLDAAIEAAYSVTDAFDLASCLEKHVKQGSFVGFTAEGN
jgi:hypothetical protein